MATNPGGAQAVVHLLRQIYNPMLYDCLSNGGHWNSIFAGRKGFDIRRRITDRHNDFPALVLAYVPDREDLTERLFDLLRFYRFTDPAWRAVDPNYPVVDPVPVVPLPPASGGLAPRPPPAPAPPPIIPLAFTTAPDLHPATPSAYAPIPAAVSNAPLHPAFDNASIPIARVPLRTPAPTAARARARTRARAPVPAAALPPPAPAPTPTPTRARAPARPTAPASAPTPAAALAPTPAPTPTRTRAPARAPTRAAAPTPALAPAPIPAPVPAPIPAPAPVPAPTPAPGFTPAFAAALAAAALAVNIDPTPAPAPAPALDPARAPGCPLAPAPAPGLTPAFAAAFAADNAAREAITRDAGADSGNAPTRDTTPLSFSDDIPAPDPIATHIPLILPGVGVDPDLPPVVAPEVLHYPIPGSPQPGYYVADSTEVPSPPRTDLDAFTRTMERTDRKRARDDTKDSETPQPQKKRSTDTNSPKEKTEWTSFTTLSDSSSDDSRSLDADGDTPMDEKYKPFKVKNKSVEPEPSVWSTMRDYLGRIGRQPTPEEPDEEL
ncbi:hypothetical protein N7527_008489 [Penicillium freii]|nr:hypothetical protein N7527_008489 [Penicillium freii]